MTWRDYAEWLGDILIEPIRETTPVPSPPDICSDTRSLRPGQWFIALSGPNFDGHDFIDKAIAMGCAGIILTKLRPSVPVPSIQVFSTKQALMRIARGWRLSLGDMKVFAITGSSGKTTTKNLLEKICSAHGPTVATQENHNNELGVAQTLLRTTQGTKYCIVEMGARHKGDIGILVDLAQPDFAGCLNVGDAHLEIFGSKKNLIAAKAEIYSASRSHSIVNADDTDFLNHLTSKLPQIATSATLFSTKNAGTINVAVANHPDTSSSRLAVDIAGNNVSIDIPHRHSTLAKNMAAAIAFAHSANIPTEVFQRALSDYSGSAGRFRITKTASVVLIDDTYNANPQSVTEGLISLHSQYPNHTKAIVLGDMLELGPKSKQAHIDIGKQVAKIKPEYLITVGSESEAIRRSAIDGDLDQSRAIHFSDVHALIAARLNLEEHVDVVYAKGSRGIHLDIYLDHLAEKNSCSTTSCNPSAMTFRSSTLENT